MIYFTGDWINDNKIMYDILEKIDFYKGGRTGPIMEGIPKNGRSMLWGSTWRFPCKKYTQVEGTGLHYTKCKEENKHLYEIYKEYIGIYWKEFEFNDKTQVQMNLNFPCPPHKDNRNIGYSILVGYGEYIGGEINIVTDEGITYK